MITKSDHGYFYVFTCQRVRALFFKEPASFKYTSLLL